MEGGRDKNIVLFDMTHGTNVYKMKLGCFTTVGADGQTIILAACLLLHEDEASFEWAFSAFLNTFRYVPAVIITDGDQGMAIAIKRIYTPHSVHLPPRLNFNHHIKPFFPDTVEWRRAQDAFWKLAKETDERSCSSFDAEFDVLVDSVKSARGTEGKIANAVKWLETLRSRHKQWAYRFTWQLLTLGADSSQVNHCPCPRARARACSRFTTHIILTSAVCAPPAL
jgi:hypothetical protein